MQFTITLDQIQAISKSLKKSEDVIYHKHNKKLFNPSNPAMIENLGHTMDHLGSINYDIERVLIKVLKKYHEED